jgi:hypothetical protein
MHELERRLHARMMDATRRCQSELNWNPSRAIQMINEYGAAEAARMMVLTADGTDGFARCWENHRLELSVEHIISDDPLFHELFTADVLEVARNRLEQARANPPRTA